MAATLCASLLSLFMISRAEMELWTCIAKSVNLQAYVADVLLEVGATPARNIDELLPGA